MSENKQHTPHKPFIAYGPGFSGDYSRRKDADDTVAANGGYGSVYVRGDLFDDLLAALEKMMDYIDNGTLVRDVERDGQPDFTVRMMHFVRDLGAAQAAIAKAKP